MAPEFELTRPDDLLSLRVETTNLRLDADDPEHPVLVVDTARLPAFLTIVFPPQTIGETAYFEASIVTPESQAPDPDAGKATEPLPGAGNVKARIGRATRLVFKVPPGAKIPFSIAGLLDWSKLELSVHPIAAIGPSPTPAQIAGAPAISAPKGTETAIELPYRLVVSPGHGVTWGHRREPFISRGRIELWHTRLLRVTPEGPVELTQAEPAPMRAIWSDDYNPIDPPPEDGEDPVLGRTAMSPSDRHQIVILTSAFHGFESAGVLSIGGALGGGALRPSALREVEFGVSGIRLTRAYVPQPFFAEELMLSSLGGWLRSRGHWDPPRPAKPVRAIRASAIESFLSRGGDMPQRAVRVRAADAPALGIAGERALSIGALSGLSGGVRIPDALVPRAPESNQGPLSLSEWVHLAAQGRDHYVRIVYEGELWPSRQRAALVKVTERKFKEQGGLVIAYLFQRMFIVVREPEKRFAGSDRGMPLSRWRLTTLVTPDIAIPAVIPGTKRSFWVEVMTGAATRARFKFHGAGSDRGGEELDFAVPMMFVPVSETSATRALAAREYNASATPAMMDARAAAIPGQKVYLAEPHAPGAGGNTRLVTRALNFVMKDAGAAPTLLAADVNIPQVQELLGTDAPTRIRLLKSFVDAGYDAKTGAFAEIVRADFAKFLPDDPFAGLVPDTMGVTFSSDQAGGFATPNLGVSTLTRDLGPLAGSAADAMADAFDPASFFKKGMAQLFGTFDLVDLLSGGTMGGSAPKLRTQTTDLPGGKVLIATLDWEPPVKNLDLKIAAFVKDHNGQTKLLVHGRIEKPVTLASLGAPVAQDVKFEFSGTLNDFQVVILGLISLNFVEFAFVSRSGAKPDIRVKLDPAKPMEFKGDLSFVDDLRKAIPPGLFGDGPSLDLSPTGIRAGFSFALPPIAVGVFALKDVSLGAALTLPFFDGKPTFDFNVSERQHPFLLSVSIFGGGGFFRLQLDTAGLKLVEAAFEFGATASIDLGLASGGVHVMAGIYFKLERKDPGNTLAPTLSGYLRMGGELSVLGLIKISLEFVLSFTYDGGRDKAYGRATLTVKVEIVFFSVSVELTVERAFGGKGGDPTFGDMFNAASVWREYAAAFA